MFVPHPHQQLLAGGRGVLGCRETLAAPGSTVANGHPGYTNNLTQGVGFQVVVDLQFHAPVLVELLMEDDLHNGSAIASTQHTKIICAICGEWILKEQQPRLSSNTCPQD